MNSILTRRFTRREIVLMMLLVLIALVGIYFYAVHYPIVQRHKEIESERNEVEFNTEVAQTRSVVYKSMKSELEEIFAMPGDELTVMPEYDNIQTLMNYFNVIFSGTDPALNFDEVYMDGKINVRTMRFSFKASSYKQAKKILGQLTSTGYRCMLENVSIVPEQNEGEIENGALKVSGVITFYELASKEQLKQIAAEKQAEEAARAADFDTE